MDNMENMDFEAMRDKQADELMQLLDERRMKELQLRLEDMNEFDVAEFLSEIGDNRMPMVFRLLSKQMAADVFANFDSPEQEQIINSITDSELSAIIEELYVDDAVDMMEELPANVVKRVMRTATPETRRLINQYLNYPENSAGSIMTAEFVDLKKYMNVRESIARIRRIGEDKETIYTCFVTSAFICPFWRMMRLSFSLMRSLVFATFSPASNRCFFISLRNMSCASMPLFSSVL